MKNARYPHGHRRQKAGRSAPGMARLGVLLGMVAAAGCAVGPQPGAPNVPAPAAYNAHPLDLHGGPQRIRWTQQESQAWWSLFHSSALNGYIRQAMQANPDLRAARMALAREQSLIAVAQGGLLPSVGAGAGIGRGRAQRTGANGGASYRIPGNLYSLLLGTINVSYNPDVFGRQKDLVHAARARAAVSRASLHQSEVFLAAAVSRAVINGAAARAQLDAARQIATADARLLRLLQQEYQLGYQNLQSVDQQEAITAAAQARIAPLQADVAVARHGLAALLGQSPDTDLPMPTLASLQLPSSLPTTLPSALAAQRPDIQAAAAELKVASAQADVATADLYPQFNITADIGKAAMTGGMFFNPISTLWSLGAGIAAPIYNGGALHAQRRAALDQYKAVSDQYRGTVLDAFREVADALRALQGADTSYQHRLAAQTAAGAALRLAEARYRDGATDYATVLDAEIAYQQDTVAAISARGQRYLDSVALFVALGDGWQPEAGDARTASDAQPHSAIHQSPGAPA